MNAVDDLFASTPPAGQPLAERMRPRTLDDMVGQRHLLGEDKPLRRVLEQGQVHSMIFWGPPGCGKTTLARLIARCTQAEMLALSAVLSGVADIRKAVDHARQRQAAGGRTLLFVDEVHRFNKAQQDAFLPHVEDGTVVFIGATTENPSFELNNALLSRSRVYVLQPVDEADILQRLQQALRDETHGLGRLRLQAEDEALQLLAQAADGDVRRALNSLEMAADLAGERGRLDVTTVRQIIGEGWRRFDKGGEAFYDQISALHKSVRNSNPDAALYWFARMLDGGCDPLYVARRVVRMASEDVGNADPRALQLALNAWEVQERLGSPEGELAIAQALVYLACAPRSNAVYTAWKAAMKTVKETGSLEVPLALRNAPTKLMKELDYGKAYQYDHDCPQGFAPAQRCFPEALGETVFYQPPPRGLEQRIAEKLQQFRQARAQANATQPATEEKSS